MTDCPNGEMRDLLPDLLHGRLEGDERAAVEAHVAGCAECRDELALLGTLRASLQRGPAVDIAAIVGALPARAPARTVARPRWALLRAAGIAALAIGGASLAVARMDPSPAPAVVANGGDTLRRGGDTVTLASGAPARTPLATPAPRAVAARPATRELAVASGVGDLSEGELAALLSDLETLDGLPATDADTLSLVPASTIPLTEGV